MLVFKTYPNLSHKVGANKLQTEEQSHGPHLCCFHLLLDDGRVNAWALQVMNDVLGVFDGSQEGCHVVPELLCKLQDIQELHLTFLCPGFDVFPEEDHLIQLILDY